MAKRGRKREAKVEAVTPGRLKSFVERIERVIAERDERTELIGEIYQEAKGIGYDVATMRKIIKLRSMDAADRDEQQTLLDTYWHALEQADRVQNRVAAGETLDLAAKAEGVSKSRAQRIVSKTIESAKAEQITHDADGVIEPPGVTGPGAAEQAPVKTSTAGSSAATISTSKESDDAADSRQSSQELGGGHFAHSSRRDPAQVQPVRSGRGDGDQGPDRHADHDDGTDSRAQQRQGRPGSGGGDHEHSDRIDVVCSGGDERAVAPVPPNAASHETADKADISRAPAAGIHGEDGPAPALDTLEIPSFLDRRRGFASPRSVESRSNQQKDRLQ